MVLYQKTHFNLFRPAFEPFYRFAENHDVKHMQNIVKMFLSKYY